MALPHVLKRSLSSTAYQSTGISRTPFGQTRNGHSVDLVRLSNPLGMSIEVINYGAHLRTVSVPDRHGELVDVTIGLADIQDYEERNDYFGGIVGRYCNRIENGRFNLSGKSYQLSNSLHGGEHGFDSKLWTVVSEIVQPDKIGIELNYVSPHQDEGYPSMCNVSCQYLLHLAENSFEIVYHASTDDETIINLTSHAFWNLSGTFGVQNSVCDGSHELQISSSFITPVDANLIPTGDLQYVGNSAFDFRQMCDVGLRINDSTCQQLLFGKGYDHNYVINRDGYNMGELMSNVAVLKSNQSGITLSIDTDQPGLQFYAGNFLDSTKVTKNAETIAYRSACALETQHFPDSPNKTYFPSTVLKKDTPFVSKTVHRFRSSDSDSD